MNTKVRCISKILKYAKTLCSYRENLPENIQISDIVIQQPYSRSFLNKNLQSDGKINLEHYRAEPGVQISTINDLKNEGDTVKNPDEFGLMKKLANRIHAYAIIIKGDQSQKIWSIEINLSDSRNHRLIIIFNNNIASTLKKSTNKNTKSNAADKDLGITFRWLSINNISQANSRGSIQNSRDLLKIKRQIKETTEVLEDQVNKQLQERETRLKHLKDNVDKMSDFSQTFAQAAHGIKETEQLSNNCPCCCKCFLKKCPILACVGCRHRCCSFWNVVSCRLFACCRDRARPSYLRKITQESDKRGLKKEGERRVKSRKIETPEQSHKDSTFTRHFQTSNAGGRSETLKNYSNDRGFRTIDRRTSSETHSYKTLNGTGKINLRSRNQNHDSIRVINYV